MLRDLAAYGSDNSDEESSQQPQLQIRSGSTASTLKFSSTLSLPTNGSPKLKGKAKRTVFTVAKPSKSTISDEDSDERPTKKPRINTRKGVGSSSLLTILPAPSKKAPIPTMPTKVLGSAAQGAGSTGVMVSPPLGSFHKGEKLVSSDDREETKQKSTTLLPLSQAKAKAKTSSLESEIKQPKVTLAPAVDFFSLGTSVPRITPIASGSKSLDAMPSSSITVSSAPTIPVVEPPPPTPTDPYPGYYQLPSGEWTAYDPEFYRKYYDAYIASVGLDGTTQKGFEGAEGENTVEIDAQSQLDLAKKEREERKALTEGAKGAPAAPRMNIKPPKIGSRARTRHQLSALLTEAYENREALEEKIAQGRRNRKEAGNKYGF